MDRFLSLGERESPSKDCVMVTLAPDLESEFREASAAQRRWQELPLDRRLDVIRRFRHEIADHARALAVAATGSSEDNLRIHEVLVSQVLPLAEACRFLERSAPGILRDRRVGGWGRPLWLAGVSSVVRREPLGVVLVVAASNYPLFLPGVQTLQAIGAGNAVLWKPGREGALAGLLMRRLLVKAGLPENVVRMLPEHESAGRQATLLPVDKIFVTGSFTTGQEVLRAAAEQVVPVTPELSGCDAVVVRSDADLSLVAKALRFGSCLNAGATCIAPRKVLLGKQQLPRLLEKLRLELDPLVSWELPTSLAGSLRLLLEEALDEGAEVLHGDLTDDGELLGPLVVGPVLPTSKILQESFFAPVLCLVLVDGDAAAVEHINTSKYALGASIFSQSVSEAKALAGRLQVGGVVVNDLVVTTADPRLPFGGRRSSGYGVTRGQEGLLEMTRTKVITVRHGSARPHFDQPTPEDGDVFESYIQAAHGRGAKSRFRSLLDLFSALRRSFVGRRAAGKARTSVALETIDNKKL